MSRSYGSYTPSASVTWLKVFIRRWRWGRWFLERLSDIATVNI